MLTWTERATFLPHSSHIPMKPVQKWRYPGLGWQFDRIIGYFGFAVMFSVAWRRPIAVGGILIASAMMLEALQALTPDRHCDLEAELKLLRLENSDGEQTRT